MEKSATDIGLLIFLHLEEKLTAPERVQLNAWLNESAENRQLFGKLTNQENIREGINKYYSVMNSSDEVFKAVLQRIKTDTTYENKNIAPVHRVHFLKTAWFRYAAAIIIVFGIGAYLWNTKETPLKNATVTTAKSDVAAPDHELATITLSNGKTITLDTLSNGLLALEGEVQIRKLDDGRIVYKGVGGGKMLYNTISVPRGSKIASLTLSDGTLVFLNSASSIKYPVAFNGGERNVEITGEAYFEVAKDAKRKFSVTGNDVAIRVLGTRFNMNTYQDEGYNSITLLDGSIRVSQFNESVIVKPGDQAIVRDKKIEINQSVDVSKVMAWKEGIFNFHQMSFSAVMRQISRWYDVDIIYPKGIPSIELGGEIQKTLSLSQMLEALGALGVKYEINGKKLTILP